MKVGGFFQVSSGGMLDIDVKITSPRDRVIYEIEKQSEGRFAFVAEDAGTHKICFSNRMSTLTAKQVTFSFNVEDEDQNDFAAREKLTPLESAILKLSEGLDHIENEQKYMRLRERAHRHTSDSTNSRVLLWSLFEAALLIGMTVWQVYYLRKFFEVKRGV
eukprot:CAMPEP_0184643844 /NCGR_PEP_ID=MMETSP0308-20130426/665_1 /TAXON_ID=38269 /ORGANISM="Gloeochaete witrockiana, Strain SAG 46.84" /LENGTH=160 /DNA_ID=CAMNT_0027072053 /DNA_START=176 /DNA_END=658 /DNA_ORIENTATION=-